MRALGVYGSARELAYVENLGTANEFVTQDLAALAERKSYFALLIVRRAAGSNEKAGTEPFRAKAPTPRT